MYEVLCDSSLLQRVRIETDDCRNKSQSKSLRFDMTALCAKPFLQSLYAEALRLYVSTSIIRSPEDGNLHLEEWTIPKGALVMIPSYVVHRDPTTWSATDLDQSRSIDTFWPERFLTHTKPLNPQPSDRFENKDKNPPQNLPASFSIDNLSGCFMPYGGGHGICPGRHFAKYEIITALATFVTSFDIEILDNINKGRVQPDLAGFGFGALKPKGRVPVRIRRRDLS